MSDSVGRPRRSRQATRQLWVERLGRFAAAALSVAAFCAAEGVSPNSFFYWKRQLTDPSPRPDDAPIFLPVRIAPAAAVEVVLPSGAGVRIAPGCDLVFGRSVIDALVGAPC